MPVLCELMSVSDFFIINFRVLLEPASRLGRDVGRIWGGASARLFTKKMAETIPRARFANDPNDKLPLSEKLQINIFDQHRIT